MVIGIDLGTTNSVVAFLEGGRPTVIANREGERSTPSVVAFTSDGAVEVGTPARRRLTLDPSRCVRSAKRHMGTGWSHPVPPGGRALSATEVSALILARLRADAEAHLGQRVTGAVITVPAYFDDAQRAATRDAGRIAGLEVLRIINEPTAAALAHGAGGGACGGVGAAGRLVCVVDLGGGTLDVSVLHCAPQRFEVVATAGDTALGGDDFDDVLAGWLHDLFRQRFAASLDDPVGRARVREAAEAAKVELSDHASARIDLPFLASSRGVPLHLSAEISRVDFQEMCAPLLARLARPLDRALLDAGVRSGGLDEVLLVGGGAAMPAVRHLVSEMCGIEATTSDRPGEVVAEGAALQAGLLAGELSDISFVDVLPLGLGVETRGGVFARMLERNTAVPVRRAEVFTTTADHERAVGIHVLQGEAEMCDHNLSLGRFVFAGVGDGARGEPRIEVCFDVDADGMVTVTARDLDSGDDGVSYPVGGATRLSDEEIASAARLAEAFAADDRARRERAELTHRAEVLAGSIAGLLAEHPSVAATASGHDARRSSVALVAHLASDDVPALRRACAEAAAALRALGAAIAERRSSEHSSYLLRSESAGEAPHQD